MKALFAKRKNIFLFLSLIVFSLLFSGCSLKTSKTSDFDLWNADGAIQEIVAYVEDVVDPKSDNYIPEEDRIAVFDLDGTLIGEQALIYSEWLLYCHRVLGDQDFVATQEMKDVAAQILTAGINKSIPEGLEEKESQGIGLAFDDMLAKDYREYVKAFLEQEADGFDGLTYKEYYFRPMVQILEYLDQNDFIIYVVSGSDRDFDRVALDEFYHIPYYHVIGSDFYSEGSNHDDVDYLEYNYDADEEVMRDSTRIIKDVKSSKIMQMYQELGQHPVMAFGNSSSDSSMFTFTAQNEKYETAVFCIVPDDDEREYAYPEKAEKLRNSCESNGYHVISMKDDFLTIYGEGVTKNPDKLDYAKRLLEQYESSK